MVSVILDTNSVIAYLNNDANAIKRIELIPELLLPVIVVGEIVFGANKSAHPEENLKPLKVFCSMCTILDCNESAANEYGRIKFELKDRGKMIPENDIWIAACAMAADLPVLSRDEHFDVVDGLRRIAW